MATMALRGESNFKQVREQLEQPLYFLPEPE
jgi:hypothetical protein